MNKHLQTFEEFIGDLETKNLKKAAIDQEEKDKDKIFVDPDQNNPETEVDDEDDLGSVD